MKAALSTQGSRSLGKRRLWDTYVAGDRRKTMNGREGKGCGIESEAREIGWVKGRKERVRIGKG